MPQVAPTVIPRIVRNGRARRVTVGAPPLLGVAPAAVPACGAWLLFPLVVRLPARVPDRRRVRTVGIAPLLGVRYGKPVVSLTHLVVRRGKHFRRPLRALVTIHPPLLGTAPVAPPAVGGHSLRVQVFRLPAPAPVPPRHTVTTDGPLFGDAPVAPPAVSPWVFAPRIFRRRRGAHRVRRALYVGTACGRVGPPLARFATVFQDARGLFRIFNAAEYRFYWSNHAPPVEGDTPDETDSSLPYTTTATFADGTWYLACTYFNGCIESGMLPIGPNGEPYLKIVITAGDDVGLPPNDPSDWRIEQTAGGVVRIVGLYIQTGSNRADEWAIAYTTDGSDPVADTPDETVDIGGSSLAALEYDLPAQGDGTTVKVLLQVRRNDGTAGSPDWVYSSTHTINSITVDTVAPSAPAGGARWRGRIPEDI